MELNHYTTEQLEEEIKRRESAVEIPQFDIGGTISHHHYAYPVTIFCRHVTLHRILMSSQLFHKRVIEVSCRRLYANLNVESVLVGSILSSPQILTHNQ